MYSLYNFVHVHLIHTLLVLHRHCIGYWYIGPKYWYRLSAILQNVYW